MQAPGHVAELIRLVEQLGHQDAQQLASRWLNEAQHLSIGLEDLGTALPSWDAVRHAVRHAVADPVASPHARDPVMQDVVLFMVRVRDEHGSR